MKKLKWIYKVIFSIMLVAVGLFMYPEKEVKALEEDYAPILIKTELDSFGYSDSDTNYYEFYIQYKLDNIVIEDLSRLEYFLVTIRPYNIRHDIYDKTTGCVSYEVYRIQILDNTTRIYVRIALLKTWIDEDYGSPFNAREFFLDDSAFYVYYASNLYDDGFNDGYNAGYDVGLQNGYNEGYGDGYEDGVLDGYEGGYNAGYDVGLQNGYNEGKEYGYNEGYIEGTKEVSRFPTLLRNAFEGVGGFLGIELLPGISIGAIIAIPIVFGVIAFILGRRRG